jgi:hypothetical protein
LCFFFFALNQICKWLFVYTRSCCTQIRNSEDNSCAVVELCCWKIVCPVSIDSSGYSTT